MFTLSIPIPANYIIAICVITLIAVVFAVHSIRQLKQDQHQRELHNYNEWLKAYCENRNNLN